MLAKPATPKRGRGYHDAHLRGSDHYRWSEDKIRSVHGYVKVRVGREHPLADPNGYAYEHLLVWVAAGNPRPDRNSVIHHRNEVKTDNRIENLELTPRSEHSQQHQNAIPDDAVRAIREAYAEGSADMPTLAASYGISVARVSKFVRGEARLAAGGPVSVQNRGKKPFRR